MAKALEQAAALGNLANLPEATTLSGAAGAQFQNKCVRAAGGQKGEPLKRAGLES